MYKKHYLYALCVIILIVATVYIWNTRRSTQALERKAALLQAIPNKTEAECMAEVNRLVSSHPKQAIREGLSQLIAAGKVKFTFDSPEIKRLSTSTAFTMMRPDGDVAIHTTRQYLFKEGDTQKYLTLFHEYQHVKQILEKRYMFLFGNQSPEKLKAMSREQLKRMARDQFNSEFEGYWAECELDTELSLDNLSCEAYRRHDIQGFKDYLAEFLATTRPIEPLVEGYYEAAEGK